MCGISGIFSFDSNINRLSEIDKINNKMTHRGPDFGSSKIIDNVALGHRRLSIIDLSSNANQPMNDISKKFHIVFNGEIYNFKEIKEKLVKLGYEFKSDSDTEVVLNSFIEYGSKCLEMFNGMFALAIYDSNKKTLFIARDSFGIKPLYVYCNKNLLYIAIKEYI